MSPVAAFCDFAAAVAVLRQVQLLQLEHQWRICHHAQLVQQRQLLLGGTTCCGT
jgi:hypothetical protein